MRASRCLALLVASVLALHFSALPVSAAVLTPEVGATTVDDGGTVTVDAVVWWADMGEYFGKGRAYVVPIQMPTLGPGESFANADLAFGQHGPGTHPVDGRTGFYGGNAPTYNIDLYGLSRASMIADVVVGDHYSGAADGSASLLQDAYLDPSSPGDRTVIHTDVSGDSALTGWLNTMYAGGANAGKYVFLRLNPDGPEGALPWSGYQVMTALAGGADEKPILSFDVVPEPASAVLLAIGAAALFCRRR